MIEDPLPEATPRMAPKKVERKTRRRVSIGDKCFNLEY